MNDEFDMEGKEEVEKEKGKIRVLDEGGDDDLDLNEEVRVRVGDDFGDNGSEIDEVRVLGGYHGNGDSGVVEGVRESLSNGGVDGDEGIDVKVENLEEREVEMGEEMEGCEEDRGNVKGGDVEKDKSEVVKEELFGVDVEESSRGGEEGENGEDEVGKGEVSGSGRKGHSGLSSSSDFGGGVDESRRSVYKDEGVEMDDEDGDFSSEIQEGFEASVSKDVSGGEIDGSLVRRVSAKLLDTEFEMGDMVWGKVKSHPWWPGHLYDEAFACSSVRRTRRDGHLLVAFFGDSSYGWFHPTELVPYDPHYAEKSQQTTSKNFVRAVEESVDEASRRTALSLSCCCRNPSNFRPTDVPGYMEVDIVDHERGAVYSTSQIQKARDAFRPATTLSFLLQAAVTPMGCDNKSLDFIKNKAGLFAYRRARYEEFDVTYAEAFATFGHKAVRSSQLPQSLTDKPSRAPLSGPLVFSESRKSSSKATKPKELAKKDRYLFKRRDNFVDSRATKLSKDQASPSSSSACEDSTTDSAAAAYVFQKRDQAASINNELGESSIIDQVATSAQAVMSKDSTSGHILTLDPDVSKKRISLGATASATPALPESDEVVTAEKHISSVTFTDVGSPHPSGGPLKKKKKAPKRPASELNSDKSELPEKKIKKPKKTDGARSLDHLERRIAGPAKLTGKPKLNVALSREDFHKDVEAMESDPQQVGLFSMASVGENEVELRQILADLHALALNPSHGVDRNGPGVARQFFLKFRSLVFLKSSSASAAAETEPSEMRATRYPVFEANDGAPTESSKGIPILKSSKLSGRHDDLTKGGRKRIPSERQEENAMKKAKKITDVKSLSAEKRAQLKNHELQRSDDKSKVAARSPHAKFNRSEHHGKKAERPPRVEEPTYLVMKFQSGSSLPSLVELKARFARFGPLDTSLSRVFYKTNTCRVAFLYKQDANVAYRYAVGSKSVFSNVKFTLKPVAAPESQQPSCGKAEEVHAEPDSNQDSSFMEVRQAALAALAQPVQLKSILKRPTGAEESGGPNNGGNGTNTPRVRFSMGEEKSNASNRGGPQVQSMESRNSVLSSYEGTPSSSSSSTTVAMDVNNNQRFMSPLPLQPPLLPSHLLRPPINPQYHHVEVTPRNNFHENVAITTTVPAVSQVLPPPPSLPPPPPPPSTDISQQMMSLLTRCQDVVTNVKSVLGYVPYHLL